MNPKLRFINYTLLYYKNATTDFHFSYEMDSPIGPLRWKEKFPMCGSAEQSPIDLDLRYCDYKKLNRPLRYYKAKQLPHNVTIENSGYSSKSL